MRFRGCIGRPRVEVIPRLRGRANLTRAEVIPWFKGCIGLARVDFKPSEWFIVLIGVVVGAIVLGISPTSLPSVSTTSSPADPSAVTTQTRMGEEWACTIVEDNLDQVNLICHRVGGGQNSTRVVQLDSLDNLDARP